MSQGNIDIQGGVLSGNGTLKSILSPLIIGENASVNPGQSPGTLTVNSDLDLFGTLVVEIVNGLSFDLLNINGTTAFASTSMIDFILAPSFLPLDGLELEFLNADALLGFDLLSLSNFSINGLVSGFDWSVIYDDVNADLSIAFFEQRQGGNSVPEAPALALMLLGLAVLAVTRRRRVH